MENKPITEKDFKELFDDCVNPITRGHAIDMDASNKNFELAKRMAIDYHKWATCADIPKKEGGYTQNELFELYQQQKQ